MRNIILGTDWFDDCDDVVAVRLLARAHKAGEVCVKGIGINACIEYSASSLEGFLNTENVYDIPVGVDREEVFDPKYASYQKMLSGYSKKIKSNDDAEDAVKMYRRILENTKEKVDIIEIGFLTVLAKVLLSEPDEISEKTGMELFTDKVSRIWIMAGKWDEMPAFNNNFIKTKNTRKAGEIFCKECPVPITFLGWEIGNDVITGDKLDDNDVLNEVMILHNSPMGNSSWDPMTVLMAIIGNENEAGYDFVSGTALVDGETGANTFVENPNGNHRYIIRKHSSEYYAKCINDRIQTFPAKILNFGSCNIDYVYSVNDMVKAGQTISADTVQKFPGGKGLNQSVAFAKAGVSVFHAGCIGNDGEFLRNILENSGVNTTYLKTVDELTGQAFIQVADNGENAIVVYGGANTKITKNHINDVLCNFSNGDFLILQNEINNIDYLIEEGFKIGMKIVFNPSPINEKIKKIDLSKITYLILNEHEATMLSGKDNIDEFIKWCRNNYPDLTVVLTLGKNGSIYFNKNEKISQQSYKANAVDTTAAGDTFTGYFFAGLCSRKTPKDALNAASMAASITVSKKGAASSIPQISEVYDMLMKQISM